MARKVNIRSIFVPLVISFGVGLIALTLVQYLARLLGENFLIYKPGHVDANKNPVLSQLSLFDMLQTAVIIALAAFLVTNISLYFARSRLYVLVLGGLLFASLSTNPLVATDSTSTRLWLELIHIAYAAPIFYGIYKYVPRLNRISIV
jgi:hypothetical protein